MDYRKVNNILGWIVFAIASYVYLVTMEETTSLWDCGEYITTANKLEVGHPPGAPLFMMLGRLFSAFVSPENAAMAVNAMSALSSSFSILFLFWTITMLAKKIATTGGEVLDQGKKIAIFGSAVVGSLAYTFTDSFWFSAVEGEVYAMSSFFTALVFWAIFKWEVETVKYNNAIDADEATTFNPNRWLIFIAYMIGLSIGVHLLNLLAIPAIGFVIYFQKTKTVDLKGILLAGVISMMTLGVVQSVVIPKIPSVADFFERMFTNDLGLSFNSGFIFFMVLVVGLLAFGIKYTAKTKKYLLNNIIVGLTMLLIGYSSFTMIVVRSNANTPLDENNPETLSSLVSYLNRDQYGSWPILRGPYFNSPDAQGCGPDDMSAPKKSFMKAYGAPVKYTVAKNLSSSQVSEIKDAVKELSIPLSVKLKDGKFQLSTPQYAKWVEYDGDYVHPDASIVSELGVELPFELTFVNLHEYETFKSKVKGVNEQLASLGTDFKIALEGEPEPKYVNMNAGKAGEKKIRTGFMYSVNGIEVEANYNTWFPRMYRKGEGAKYMAWIDYANNEHSVPLPPDPQIANLGIQGRTKPEQYSQLVQMSLQSGAPQEYQNIANQMSADGLYKPNMSENLSYMFSYQINWMYFRYFMWNFSGRQNDLQGYGVNGGGKKLLEGNWLTGVDFIDAQRLGSQESLPDFIAKNKGYNKYYLLPLILALIGLIFHTIKAPKDMFSVLLLFLLTGLAIVVYLNQKPMEPRERDYAYAASFYAFAIWIGIGVYALFDTARNFDLKKYGIIAAYAFGTGAFIFLVEMVSESNHAMSYSILYMSAVGVGVYGLVGFVGKSVNNGTVTAGLASGLAMSVPIVLGVQNWDDHDRSNRTTARDFAYNYLLSCDEKSEGGKGAVIFTNGDNDTFPLWYLQEVEEERTDVRVANMSLLGTDWHINQMKRQAYDSEPLDITMNEFSYRQGTRDYVIIDEDNAKKYISGNKWAEIDSKTDSYAQSAISAWAQQKPGEASEVTLLSYIQCKKYIKASKIGSAYSSKDIAQQEMPADIMAMINSVSLDSSEIAQAKGFVAQVNSVAKDEDRMSMLNSAFGMMQNEISQNLSKWQQVFYPLDEAVDFILDDNNVSTKFNTCQEESYLNCRKVYITVDKEAALKSGIITADQMDKVEDTLYWSVKGSVIYKSDLAVLDMLRNYKWDRPIYFASQAGLQANANIIKYLQSEGLAFKFTPINFGTAGGVNLDKMYDLMMDKEKGFQWGNMKGDGVLVDYYTMRMVYNLRVQIMKFTEKLLDAGEKQKAIDVLDRAFEEMPIEDNQVAPGDICYYLCLSYYDAGAKEKGDALAKKLIDVKLKELNYYAQQQGDFFTSMAPEFARAMQILEMLREGSVPGVSSQRMMMQSAMQEVQTQANAKFSQLEANYNAGVFKSQEEIEKAQQDIEKWYESEMAKVQVEHFKKLSDPSMTYFTDLGPFEGTQYTEVMAKAKAKFMETRFELRSLYESQKNFPINYYSLWGGGF